MMQDLQRLEAAWVDPLRNAILTSARTIETRELIATVRRVAKEQPLYRPETILHLTLAAAELERMAYPSQSDAEVKHA